MKKIITAFVAMMFTIVFLQAETITITTGSKTGTYIKEGMRIANIVKASGSEVKVETSKGSVQNLDRLLKGDAQVAIAQRDAYAAYLKQHGDAEEAIEELGLLGQECVYAVAKKDGKVSSDSDMQKEGITVAAGKIGSGTRVTWQYMGMLEKGFTKATAVPKGGSRTLNKVITGKYDVYLQMQSPSTTNKLVTTVINNPNLEFIDITDWDLNDKLNGKPIYTFEKVTVQKGTFTDTKIKTICTNAAVYIRSDINDDVADALSDALLNNKKYIMGAN